MLLSFGAGSYAQFITVLILFAVVLAIAAVVTKWIAGVQKQQNTNNNIEVIETNRIGNNKYVQILRIGERYVAIAVGKDSVTMLGEVRREELKEKTSHSISFREILDRTARRTNLDEVKDDLADDKTNDEN